MIPTVGHKNTVETKAQSVMNTQSQTSYQLQLQPRRSRNIWGTAVVKLNIDNKNSHTRKHSGTHGRTHTFTDTTHTQSLRLAGLCIHEDHDAVQK